MNITHTIRAIFVPLFLMAGILTAGCSTMKDVSHSLKDSLLNYEKVKPWQKGELAKEDMQLVDDGLMTYADDHIYFSKEAATGGKGVGGGGCGCN